MGSWTSGAVGGIYEGPGLLRGVLCVSQLGIVRSLSPASGRCTTDWRVQSACRSLVLWRLPPIPGFCVSSSLPVYLSEPPAPLGSLSPPIPCAARNFRVAAGGGLGWVQNTLPSQWTLWYSPSTTAPCGECLVSFQTLRFWADDVFFQSAQAIAHIAQTGAQDIARSWRKPLCANPFEYNHGHRETWGQHAIGATTGL